MDLKIDITKLTDSPYSVKTKKSFQFDDEELIKSVVLELQNAHPSSFLISGYRGVGKTSFVNRVIDQIKANTVCASLNLAKYDGYPRLIKKLIRQLFISYQLHASNTKSDDSVLMDEFKLLYDRTFHDISNSKSSNVKKEFKITSEIEFDLKKLLVPVSFFVLLLLNITTDFFSVDILNWVAMILTAIWLFVKTWKLVTSFSRSTTDSSELSRKSLYDDEIAEHHLLNILEKLSSKNIQVLISLDEIDKIQDVNGAIKIMDDLKPLMLSGYANFFIVAGQNLYYEYERATQRDNEVISTLFSRVIHIPFLKHSTLKTYCLNLLKKVDLKTEESVNDYFDSIILSSSRVPRKLVNQIRSKLVWKETTPYLSAPESAYENFAYEAKLLASLTTLMDNQLPAIAKNDVQLDFFIAQIYLWIGRMRQNIGIPFYMSQVIQDENYNYVPDNYIAQLPALGEMLTDELVIRKFIKVKELDEQEQENSYVWILKSAINDSVENPEPISASTPSPEDDEKFRNNDHTFVSDFTQLESLTRRIWNETQPNVVNMAMQPFGSMINRLVDQQILTQSWYDSAKINSIITIRNEIVHGTISQEDGIKSIQAAQFNLNRLRAEIIENYLFYVCRQSLKDYEFTRDNRGGFDFIAYQPSITLAFDVKYLQSGHIINQESKQLLEKFKTFREITKQNCHYIFICFQSASRQDSNFYNKLNETLEQGYAELKPFVEVIYLLEDALLGIGPSLNTSLLEIEEGLTKEDLDFPAFHTPDEIKNIEENIRQASLEEWPNDFDMQLNFQDSQRDAIREIRKLNPVDLGIAQFNLIAEKAKTDWPKNYERQLHTFREQSEALHQIRKLQARPLSETEFNQILANVAKKWPGDYKMQLNHFESQKQALMLLKNYKVDDIEENILQQLKTKIAAEWPDNYEMQLSTLESRISSLRNEPSITPRQST